MAVVCASRFAVLKIDDDVEKSAKVPSIKPNAAQAGKSKPTKAAPAETKTNKTKKKKKINTENAELQNLAFGSASNKSKKSSASKSGNASQKQWEEWKKKDSEFVSEVYEQELQQALLLSKIDYEEKKDVYDAIQKETEQSKQKKKKKNNHKKEKNVMSLDEFQSLSNNQIETGCSSKDAEELELPCKVPLLEGSNFFTKIEEDAERVIRQEHNKATVPESARLLQLQEELRKKDEEITTLTETLEKLRAEFKNVKTRNKRLCNILISGEMREKAEILVQVEQLETVKNELTEQLEQYHTALEQERSKVHALKMDLQKCQNSKKNRLDSK